MSRLSRSGLRYTVCYFCGGPATETLILNAEWKRPICEACLVDQKLTTADESKARQVADLRALLAELGPDDLFDTARRVTDEVCGDGTYARLNDRHPDPGVQRAITKWRAESWPS